MKEEDIKIWICAVCGYRHDGPTPPAVCPECGAPRDRFVEL